jgi:hypothetical protein
VARVGISITKSCAFRNSTQEFSNVYFYDGLSLTPSPAQADALIDEAVTREKTWHSTGVTFVRGRCWLQTSDKATTEMISQKNLSGTGSGGAPTANMDRERAWLFRLRAGVDVRGNPVYLRKWFHTLGGFGAASVSQSILEQTGANSQATRDTAVGVMNSIGSIGSGVTAGVLCAKSGRLPTAGQVWSCHAYLEHRQLGDQWRAN